MYVRVLVFVWVLGSSRGCSPPLMSRTIFPFKLSMNVPRARKKIYGFAMNQGWREGKIS
ncbi:MAG: hypothetical protein QXQ21_09740 [Candidatus Jordarchaeales archaeon]